MKNTLHSRQQRQQALANAIRFLRLKYHMKRQYLAAQTGLSIASYEKLEQGKTQARFTEVAALCEAMGAPLEELMQHYQRELNKY